MYSIPPSNAFARATETASETEDIVGNSSDDDEFEIACMAADSDERKDSGVDDPGDRDSHASLSDCEDDTKRIA